MLLKESWPAEIMSSHPSLPPLLLSDVSTAAVAMNRMQSANFLAQPFGKCVQRVRWCKEPNFAKLQRSLYACFTPWLFCFIFIVYWDNNRNHHGAFIAEPQFVIGRALGLKMKYKFSAIERFLDSRRFSITTSPNLGTQLFLYLHIHMCVNGLPSEIYRDRKIWAVFEHLTLWLFCAKSHKYGTAGQILDNLLYAKRTGSFWAPNITAIYNGHHIVSHVCTMGCIMWGEGEWRLSTHSSCFA